MEKHLEPQSSEIGEVPVGGQSGVSSSEGCEARWVLRLNSLVNS